eukprot:scaffold3545_cov1181-Pavlova_lutheri.AAC.1
MACDFALASGRIEVVGEHGGWGFHMHPAVLDCSLQTVAALSMEEEGGTKVPYGLRAYVCVTPCDVGPVDVAAFPDADGRQGGRAVTTDYCLFGSSGTISTLRGLEARSMGGARTLSSPA